MNSTPTKSDIFTLLHFSHQQERQFVDGLSDAERDAIGTQDAWAAKDFLVNIMTWKELQTQKLAMAVRGETPPVWRDMQLVHQINSQAIATYKSKSFREVEAEAEKIFDAFITQVNSLSEEELTAPDHFDWQDGEPLWEETLGNGIWHPISQLTDYYLKHGETQPALELQECLLTTVRETKLPAEELGVVIYNRICIYATNGWPEKALALLPEALRLRPTLIEWSKHDSDLDSLRVDPTFQAIFHDAVLMEKAPASDLISPQQTYANLSADMPPVIIDVRGPSEFAAGHVQGAQYHIRPSLQKDQAASA